MKKTNWLVIIKRKLNDLSLKVYDHVLTTSRISQDRILSYTIVNLSKIKWIQVTKFYPMYSPSKQIKHLVEMYWIYYSKSNKQTCLFGANSTPYNWISVFIDQTLSILSFWAMCNHGQPKVSIAISNIALQYTQEIKYSFWT